jgi:hypothetical protein
LESFVLVLGIVSFFARVPIYDHEGVTRGDIHPDIATAEPREKMPVAAGVVLVVVGAGLIIAGKRLEIRS